MPFFVGLDLGQSQDYTALAVIHQLPTAAPRSERELHLRHLERYPLRTPYPDMVDRVGRLLSDPKLTLTELGYDVLCRSCNSKKRNGAKGP